MGSLTPALPADVTSFVGRRHDIAAVRRLLSAARLVTLTGIGGVGKTRLAVRVARDAQRAFPDGVHLVELASVKDAPMLPHVVIDALDLREQSARGPMTVLGDYLSRRRMLIVLDNCEHLVDAAADLTNGMLRVAPDVRVLATSRQSLGIAGEHVYPVPPLPVGALDEPVPPGTAAQYPSVTLFVERAAAVIPGFSLTAENETAVVRLCQRLEGIPLAIELAAVQLRVLSVDELAGRLDDRFRLLRAGGRNLPERHRTLKAVVDWSHDLCTSAERTLWARASMFAGGFGVDALEAVCSDDTLSEDDVLETVAGLLDKSIFLREERGKQVRFRMVETLRSYGQARLAESEDEAALRRRHRDWYLRQLETAGEEWAGPRQEEWASWLMAEHATCVVPSSSAYPSLARRAPVCVWHRCRGSGSPWGTPLKARSGWTGHWRSTSSRAATGRGRLPPPPISPRPTETPRWGWPRPRDPSPSNSRTPPHWPTPRTCSAFVTTSAMT